VAGYVAGRASPTGVIEVTNATVVTKQSTAIDRQEMAEEILVLLRFGRQVKALLESGYEIGILCGEIGIMANATPTGGAGPTLTARVNVAEWWDPKQLSKEEWSRQLAHALSTALRAAGKRAGIADYGTRYESPLPAHRRLRLQMPLQPGRGFRLAR
jgi:hypothetical protein